MGSLVDWSHLRKESLRAKEYVSRNFKNEKTKRKRGRGKGMKCPNTVEQLHKIKKHTDNECQEETRERLEQRK